MKFCTRCSVEISTVDGVNTCGKCRQLNAVARASRKREREQLMRDCGLVKVKGAMGSVYWE